MRTALILFAAFFAWAATAHTNRAPAAVRAPVRAPATVPVPARPPTAVAVPVRTAPTPDTFEAQAIARAKETPAILNKPKLNEIRSGKTTFSGIAVELAKAPNKLQLLNPAAPPIYGSPEDNVVRNPINGQLVGLKIFSLHF